MPFTPWALPTEYVARTRGGVSVYTIRTDAEQRQFRDFVIAQHKAIQDAKEKALQADNLDAYCTAWGHEFGLATLVFNMEATGNKDRPERDGLWVAGWALYQTKEHYAAETLSVKVNPGELLARSQRIRTLSTLVEMLDEFRDTADDSLAEAERELAPQVRLAHSKLEPQYESNFGLRRMARPVEDYSTGAAKLAAVQAKKNRKLVADTKAGLLAQVKESSINTTPAPAPTPPAATPPTTPTTTPEIKRFTRG